MLIVSIADLFSTCVPLTSFTFLQSVKRSICLFVCFKYLGALSRRLVAQEETNNRHHCKSGYLTKASTKTNSVLPSTSSPLKKGETTPYSRGRLSFERWCAPSFRPSEKYTKQRGTQTNRRNTLIPKKAHNVQTVTKIEGFRQANSNSKRSTLPQENLSDTVNTVKKVHGVATQSYKSRHSWLCSYTCQGRSRLPSKRCTPGFYDSLASTCLLRRVTTTRFGSTSAKRSRTNQRTRLERFCRDKGVGRHVVRSRHWLLREKEAKELAMRPILLRDVPIGGCCAQAHTVPRVQARPDAFPKGPFPHLLQNLDTNTTAGHCNPHDLPREASNQRAAQVGILEAL